MKILREKLCYISNRVHILAWGTCFAFMILLLLETVLVYRKRCDVVLLLYTGVIFIFFLSLYILWIYRPFRLEEKETNQFLDGYVPYGKLEETENVMLTPSTLRERKKIVEILTSAKLYNLNKRQAQYLALQNQINPHFLYNTLDGIRSEALVAGVDHVAEMTEALATFFRYTISNVENLVTVEDELENCRIYFRIQQYRFGDRLNLVIECEEDNRQDILQCRIPKLTLQPVLENSIIHGTELKLGKGIQTIHLMLTEKRLLIRVSDDGVGMDEKTLAELNDKLGRSADQLNSEEKGGIALYNVNHRIQLIFGEEYGMHIYSIENVGTDVEISIPAIYSENEVKNRSVFT